MRLAADTNVLLDLADEIEHVLDALAVIDEQLTWLLNQHDLTAPVIATPHEIVRKFFRR